jgi:hypothetical protein
MQHVWGFCCPISEVLFVHVSGIENAPRQTLSGDPGIAAFSRSFARVSCYIHTVASNHGEEVVAPLEF